MTCPGTVPGIDDGVSDGGLMSETPPGHEGA
jgi:hypothetical protein